MVDDGWALRVEGSRGCIFWFGVLFMILLFRLAGGVTTGPIIEGSVR